MPKFTLTDAQISDIAAFVHTFRAAGYDESRLKPPSIVVGDAKAGEAFFNAKCASCHSTTGDLRGLATKITRSAAAAADVADARHRRRPRRAAAGRRCAPTTVTVTLPSGEKVDGRLDRIDDFIVALTSADGTRRSFRTERRHAEGGDSRSAAAAPGSAARSTPTRTSTT